MRVAWLLVLADGGGTWQKMPELPAFVATGVFGTAGGVYVFDENGAIRRAPGPVGFTEVRAGDGTALTAMWGRSDDDLYAVGDGGVILHGDTGGTRWTAQDG